MKNGPQKVLESESSEQNSSTSRRQFQKSVVKGSLKGRNKRHYFKGFDRRSGKVREEESSQFIVSQDKLEERSKRFNSGTSSHDRKEFGYISRGEDLRLQKSVQYQEDFFKSILSSFVKFCNENSSSEISISLKHLAESEPHLESAEDSKVVSLSSILSSLRKLREALISQKPNEFSKKVFLFSIRLSSSMGHFQTFVPSIMHLLQDQNILLLENLEVQEISTLLVLYVSHHNKENSKALSLFFKYLKPFNDTSTKKVLEAWIQKDYYLWLRLFNNETDSSRSAIMRQGIPVVIQHMVICVSKAYYTMSLNDFEERFLPKGVFFDTIVKDYNLPWKRDEKTITFRHRK